MQSTYGYKVLSDEYIISAQAKSLHYSNTLDYPEKSFWAYSELKGLAARVDKRPPAFAALLSVVHDLFGYRPENAFWLNTFVGYCFIVLLLFSCGCGLGDKKITLKHGVVALILLASLPLFSVNMTGAGLDLYNLFLITFSAALSYQVLQTKCDVRVLRLWILVSLLLCYARYESVLYVASCGLILLRVVSRNRAFPAFGTLCLLPILLVPYLFQHRVFDAYPEVSWQQPSSVAIFSLSYVLENIGHAVEYFYLPTVAGSGSALLGWMGTFAALVWGVRLLRDRMRGRPISNFDFVIFAYGIVICSNFCLLMGYHWGRVDELEVSRLTLPLYLFFGGCVLRVLGQFESKAGVRLWAIFGFLGLGYVCLVSVPSRSSQPYLKHNYHALVNDWALEKLREDGAAVPLVVSEANLFWYLHDISAMSSRQVLEALDRFNFHFSKSSFTPYVLECVKVSPVDDTETVVTGGGLSDLFETEVLAKKPYKPYHYARLVRINGFKDASARRFQDDSSLELLKAHPIEAWFYFIP